MVHETAREVSHSGELHTFRRCGNSFYGDSGNAWSWKAGRISDPLQCVRNFLRAYLSSLVRDSADRSEECIGPTANVAPRCRALRISHDSTERRSLRRPDNSS